jgi:hypothetical protein
MAADMEDLPKPRELLAARASTEALFKTLRDWFEVPERITIDLESVDSAVAELGDPQFVMAMAMRKLQALHLLTTPGVRTTTDVVLTVIQDLERALLQAPGMHLRNEAAETDWDAALAELDDETPDAAGDELAAQDPGVEHPARPVGDDEIAAFRRHHALLHEAARAVLRVSDGEIRRLV